MDTTNTKHRVQFEFSTEAYQRVEDLRVKTNASTKAEVLRNALRLYEWFINEFEPDYEIKVDNENGENIYHAKVKFLVP